MVRTDNTPWEPGTIVLSNDDLRGKNPYNGMRLTSQAVFNILGVVGVVCYQSDSNITLIQRQSKH